MNMFIASVKHQKFKKTLQDYIVRGLHSTHQWCHHWWEECRPLTM